MFTKRKVQNILSKKGASPFREFLKTLSNRNLYELGKAIIWKDCDGHNNYDRENRQIHFDSCDRWQKEVFVNENSYQLNEFI